MTVIYEAIEWPERPLNCFSFWAGFFQSFTSKEVVEVDTDVVEVDVYVTSNDSFKNFLNSKLIVMSRRLFSNFGFLMFFPRFAEQARKEKN